MRAVQFSRFGDPADVLSVHDVDDLDAGPGQVRIEVRAAGVNPIDWKVVGGLAGGSGPDEPRTAGGDVAGVVDEVGDGVTDVRAGDEVFGFAETGALAEQALLREYAVKPPNLPFEVAAGLPVPVETAQRVLDLLGLEAGQTLLVDGAAGGVGVVVVQIARARGANVIGTASEGNHEYLRTLGVTPTTYGEGLVERVSALAPNGVDRALDTAGKGSVPDLVTLTGNPDAVVTIADFSAGEHGVHNSQGGGARTPALRRAAELCADGTLSMPIARTYVLDEAAQAYQESKAGHVRGKLVITVG